MDPVTIDMLLALDILLFVAGGCLGYFSNNRSRTGCEVTFISLLNLAATCVLFVGVDRHAVLNNSLRYNFSDYSAIALVVCIFSMGFLCGAIFRDRPSHVVCSCSKSGDSAEHLRTLTGIIRGINNVGDSFVLLIEPTNPEMKSRDRWTCTIRARYNESYTYKVVEGFPYLQFARINDRCSLTFLANAGQEVGEVRSFLLVKR